MAQKLEHNDKIVTVNPVDIPLFESDVEVIQKLNDEPNDVEGLSAQELKERFDQAGVELKAYINETLIPLVESDGLTEQARAQAEVERIQNEQERVANENERIANEEARSVFEEYQPATTYYVGNKVAYNSSSYVCIKECFNVNPDDTAHWLLIARKGVSPSVRTQNVNGGTEIIITYGEGGETVRLFVPTQSGGGMQASVYDPQNKRQDVFAYADKAGTFVAVHNVTTYEELEEAYNAGKAMVLVADGHSIPFDCIEGRLYTFRINRYGTYYNYWCSPDYGWKSNNVPLPISHASRHKTGGADALAPADIGAAVNKDWTLSVTHADASGGLWKPYAGGYQKTIYVGGMLSTDKPIVDVVLANDNNSNKLWLDAWSKVSMVSTANNYIYLRADNEAPAVNFNIKVKVVR